ncbi:MULTISPECIES: YczE/YyaS/YitT family protein [Pseudomonas]|uniref:YczE/YyaS/YitT family protein n=1 Tax=Pseudomonas TaxID=286 RepID=UPI0006B46910|nr:membrane protein [Pseudomonas fuscovaginae]KPA95986.1 putative membrane protein [Pseudomonas fuscovaginae]
MRNRSDRNGTVRRVLIESARAWSAVDRLSMYLGGVVVFSLGALFFITSHLGTDPLDVFVIGLNGKLNLGLGACSAIFSIAMLAWWALWNKRWPPISPFVTTTLTGLFIDLWLLLEIDDLLSARFTSYVMLAIGLALCAYASALIIMSGIGIRVIDLMVITIMRKVGWSFTFSKMVLEISIFLAGWVLGGPFGIGTIAFLLIIAPLIRPFMNLNERYLRLSNYGLSQRQSLSVE